MTSFTAPFLAGAGLGASLIIAIGAQNAFVLRQGVARRHVVAVVATCVVCDWALIAAGAIGFGQLVAAFPALMTWTAWGGAAFLAVYGALSFKASLRPGSLRGGNGSERAPLASTAAAVGATLAVSLLNPHVYLDTVVLLGSVASQYPGVSRVAFVAGAWVASAAWFSAVGFGAGMLAPAFERPGTWRVLDVGIGVVMWGIAITLVWPG